MNEVITLRLDDRCEAVVKQLMDHYGFSRSAAIRFALLEMDRRSK